MRLDRSIEVGAGKLLVAFAVIGALTIVLTFWIQVSLLSLGQERLRARDCPQTLKGVIAPTSVSKRIQGEEVVCVYRLPNVDPIPITQPRAELGFLKEVAIYVLNLLPILVFASLAPRDPSYRGDPPRRTVFGFFGMIDPRFELVGGSILLAMGAEFLWFVLSSSTTGLFVGFFFVVGVFSLVRGWRRLRESGALSSAD